MAIRTESGVITGSHTPNLYTNVAVNTDYTWVWSISGLSTADFISNPLAHESNLDEIQNKTLQTRHGDRHTISAENNLPPVQILQGIAVTRFHYSLVTLSLPLSIMDNGERIPANWPIGFRVKSVQRPMLLVPQMHNQLCR
jgi:hypothetical protein